MRAKKATAPVRKKTREFSVVIERDTDGWFVASVPELPGCHTQAKSQDQLMRRTAEAIEAYLDAEGDTPDGNEFVGIQRVVVGR